MKTFEIPFSLDYEHLPTEPQPLRPIYFCNLPKIYITAARLHVCKWAKKVKRVK
jgi:hypothetical protein